MRYNYEDLIENLYDGLYFTDRERKIIFWNRSAEKITGYKADEVVGKHCSDNILIHVDDKGNSLCNTVCPLAASIHDGTAHEAEVYLHHKEGHRVPVWVRVTPLKDENGNIIGGAELFTDISSREAMRLKIQELEELSFLDGLTHIANRRYIELDLESRLAELKRYGLPFGILFMDVDRFKFFNDTYGHDTGDLILKTTANTLLSTARPFDLIGRWGGEEFIGIIRNVDAETLSAIGNRFRVLVEKTQVRAAGEILNVTISVGATMATSLDSTDSIIKRADRLMYRSKDKGRNCVTTDLDPS